MLPRLSITRFIRAGCLALAAVAGSHAAASVTLEGVEIDETMVENGARLVLNGAAVHKRGYFKTEVVALYVQRKSSDPEEIYRTSEIRVLRRVLLKDIPVSTASRYFINDFKLAASEEEFKQLINEVGATGGIYGTVAALEKGDIVESVWIPGGRMYARFNGKVMGDGNTKIGELFFKVYMRMHIGPKAPGDFRNGLLGIGK